MSHRKSKPKKKKSAVSRRLPAISKRSDFKPEPIDPSKIIKAQHKRRRQEIKQKESKYPLTHRISLNPEQMERAKLEAAGGADQKYEQQPTGEFKQSLQLTKAVAKAYEKSSKYVLYDDEHGRKIYVAANKIDRITFDLEAALIFADGFDDPSIKANHYNRVCKLNFKYHRIVFKPHVVQPWKKEIHLDEQAQKEIEQAPKSSESPRMDD